MWMGDIWGILGLMNCKRFSWFKLVCEYWDKKKKFYLDEIISLTLMGRINFWSQNQSPSNILESTSAPKLKLKFLLRNIIFMLLMFMCNGFGWHDIIVVQVVNGDKVEKKKNYLQFVAIFHHYNKAAWW